MDKYLSCLTSHALISKTKCLIQKKLKREFRSMYNCIDVSYLKYKDHKSVLIHYSENSHIQQRTVPMKMTSVIAPDMETCAHLTSSQFPLEGKTPCQSHKAKINQNLNLGFLA